MSTKKVITNGSAASEEADASAMAEEIKKSAEEAEAVFTAAQKETDIQTYTHTFQTPFTFEGRTFERLSFDWGALTGMDSLAIEDEMNRKGKTLVTPAFSGEYLAGMAARACTERDEDGKRVVSAATIRALPLADFQRVCGRARTFLMRAGL